MTRGGIAIDAFAHEPTTVATGRNGPVLQISVGAILCPFPRLIV